LVHFSRVSQENEFQVVLLPHAARMYQFYYMKMNL
jgi:hypothetical protein